MASRGDQRTGGLQARLDNVLDEFVAHLDGIDFWGATDVAQQMALLDDVEATLDHCMLRHGKGMADTVVDFGELLRA